VVAICPDSANGVESTGHMTQPDADGILRLRIHQRWESRDITKGEMRCFPIAAWVGDHHRNTTTADVNTQKRSPILHALLNRRSSSCRYTSGVCNPLDDRVSNLQDSFRGLTPDKPFGQRDHTATSQDSSRRPRSRYQFEHAFHQLLNQLSAPLQRSRQMRKSLDLNHWATPESCCELREVDIEGGERSSILTACQVHRIRKVESLLVARQCE
jgi:hypothetical protein